jgi:transcription elongation GreA/GreB family factor
MGKALLGAMVEDEISLALGDKVRIATVLGIEKRSPFN